eukprot:UN09559
MSEFKTFLDKDKCNSLVHGYIRNIQQLLTKQIIPESITRICFQFYFIMIDSVILDDGTMNVFVNLFRKYNKVHNDNGALEFSCLDLIYRASVDGWGSSDFHKKCDNKSNTITIIHNRADNIFGGYASIPWTQDSGYKSDDKALIFLIKSSTNLNPQIFGLKVSTTAETPWRAVHHYDCTQNWMFGFGDGHDIGIHSNSNNNYESRVWTSYYNTPTTFYLNGGEQHYAV